MIPLFIDFTGRRVVIFGGGNVAARKAACFSGKADLVVISRSFVAAFESLEITREGRDLGSLSDRDLGAIIAGAFLVIAALPSPAINNRIGALCREQGILFNNADGEKGDVILPAVSSGTNHTIAISTGGTSPAVSRFLREHLEREFPALDAMILLQDRLREALKDQEPDQKRRTAILTEVIHDPGIWRKLTENPSAVWDEIRRRYLHD